MYKEVADFKLSDGQILTFDNMRVLNDRLECAEIADNSRCVVGLYVDWYQMLLKWRVLKKAIWEEKAQTLLQSEQRSEKIELQSKSFNVSILRLEIIGKISSELKRG